MTVELVTGHAGTGHIDGFDVGGLIGGIAGDGDYVLQEPYGTISCTVKDNNHVIIGKGDLIMSGRHVRIEDPETLTVQSGTQGQQRHDLVVMRYSRQSSGIETAELRVLRGTPGASGTPWYDTGSILNGSTTREMPLYRLDLNGISLNTAPARLFSTLTPVSAIMSGVVKQMSQSQRIVSVQWTPPYSASGDDSKLTLTRQGNLVTVSGAYNTYKSGDLGTSVHAVNEKMPYGYRPRGYAYIISGTGRWIIGYDPNNQRLNVRGDSEGKWHTMVGTWFTDDQFPA